MDVIGLDTFGRSVLGLAFTYVAPLSASRVEPNVVDDDGSTVDVFGSGFFDTDDRRRERTARQPHRG